MPELAAPAGVKADDQAFADRVIAEFSGRPGALLSILERLQEHRGWAEGLSSSGAATQPSTRPARPCAWVRM
jgi:hypothetical protein